MLVGINLCTSSIICIYNFRTIISTHNHTAKSNYITRDHYKYTSESFVALLVILRQFHTHRIIIHSLFNIFISKEIKSVYEFETHLSPHIQMNQMLSHSILNQTDALERCCICLLYWEFKLCFCAP